MAYENYQPLVEVTRGPIVESVHFGAAAVVDAAGNLVASLGDPRTVAFLRSSAKPFQALPFVEMDGPSHFGLTDEEVAVLCSSHSGTDRHFEVVSSIQAKVGIRESDLQCGTHYPLDDETSAVMRLRGENPTNNHNNCSGKHTGMLAQAVLRNLPLGGYLENSHPVQAADLQAFCDLCGLTPGDVLLGVDGCTAPVFAVPLYNGALAYAHLAGPDDLPPARAQACRDITRAMTSFPFMVAGPNRFDTALMEAGCGRIVSKGGAEGYHAIGLLPGALGPGSPAIGIAIKTSDGDLTGRSNPVIAIEILRQLGALNEDQLSRLKNFDRRPVLNHNRLPVGEIRACFKLQRHS